MPSLLRRRCPCLPALILCCLGALLGLASLPAAADPAISYTQSIQPIFEGKCVVCHACYEAPCQLNLGSGPGLDRGATQALFYDGNRTHPVPPTRLFTDASNTAGWRQKGFYSVLGNSPAEAQTALLAEMLALGRQADLKPNARLPDDIVLGSARENSCPATPKEFGRYADKHPREGMPLAVSGLTDREYNTIRTWLAQGAPIDAKPRVATSPEQQEVREWESFLNQRGLREQLVARWLYEHLFLAHLYFSDIRDSHFFEVVRSRTPSGQPIDLIATTAPDQDPGAAPFYYRLRPVQGSLVFKTHITLALSPAKLERTRHQFLDDPWTVSQLPGYSNADQTNPFLTFSAIPAQARYQFMLDNAEYFIRTFIRGPVCHGQIATDVIRDQFWTVFQDPAHDLYITDASYRAASDPLLAVPGEADTLLELAPQWLKYLDLRNRYEKQRAISYATAQPQGPSVADIWNGDGHNDNAMLTIFRHFDSAAVRKGLIGEIPQTLWLMDYPLFERTYYVLVANFNVFGSVSHQAQTRLYFDLIRNGAEMNFLRLLPPEARKRQLEDWYQGSGELKLRLTYESADFTTPTNEVYTTADPKKELAVRLLQRFNSINASPDPINRCSGGHYCSRANAPDFARTADQSLSRIASRPAASLPVINWLPEMTLLRVYKPDGGRQIYSMLRNRAHSNVAFLMGEDLRYQPEKDTLTIYPGVLGGYPNFAFNIPVAEIGAFTDAMQSVSSQQDLIAIIERWGVRRSSPDFWPVFHDFTTWMRETEPVEASILDMSRYENL